MNQENDFYWPKEIFLAKGGKFDLDLERCGFWGNEWRVL